MNYWGIILDIVLVGVFVFSVIASAKRGFVRSFVETAGFVVALLLALSFSKPVAGMIYDRTVAPAVVSAVDNAVINTTQDTVDSVWSALPTLITDHADKFGLSRQSLTAHIDGTSGQTAAELAQSASQNIVRPIVVQLLGMLISVVLFAVLFFVVKILSRALNKIFSFSVIGDLNKTLGGVLGAVRGVALMVLVAMVVRLIGGFLPGGAALFDPSLLEGSFIYKTITSILPFSGK